MENDITSRRCSLTYLNVKTTPEDQVAFVSLLSAASSIRCFIVEWNEVGWRLTPLCLSESHRDFVSRPFHTVL